MCKSRGHCFKTCVNNNKDTSNKNKTSDKLKVKTSKLLVVNDQRKQNIQIDIL